MRSQDVEDCLTVGGIGLAGYIGDNWNGWRLDIHACDHFAQRLAGRGNYAGMESMRDGDLGGLQAGRQESADGRIHGGGFPANDTLHRAVDVGNDDIARDGLKDTLHLGQRR